MEGTKPTTIRLSNFFLDDIIGKVKNKNARIEELLMKGYLYEKEQTQKQSSGQVKESSPARMSTQFNFLDGVSPFAVDQLYLKMTNP